MLCAIINHYDHKITFNNQRIDSKFYFVYNFSWLLIIFFAFLMSQLEKRRQIQTLWEGRKHSVKGIGIQLGVSMATVYRVIKRVTKNQPLAHLKGAGRPSNKRKIIARTLAQQIRRNPVISQVSKCPKKVSKSTVGYWIRDLNYSKKFPTKVQIVIREKSIISYRMGQT